jgi:hypothetical protein
MDKQQFLKQYLKHHLKVTHGKHNQIPTDLTVLSKIKNYEQQIKKLNSMDSLK